MLCQFVDKPFWGHHDWNSNVWTVTARNNIEHGIWCTGLGQSTTPTPIENCSQLRFYSNHPPLISWVLTLSYWWFGMSEWAGRLPLILISTGSVLLVMFIGNALVNLRTGLIASSLMLSTVMFQYFGVSLNHEPLIVFGVLWAVYAYIVWIQSKGISGFEWLIGSAVWVGLAGWHGYVVFGLLAGLTFFIDRRLFIRSLIPIGVLIFMFGLVQVHIWWVSGEFNWGLFEQFLRRVSLGGEKTDHVAVSFGIVDFVKKQLVWARSYYSSALLVGSGLYVAWLNVHWYREKRMRFSHGILAVLGLYGLSIIVVFNQQAWIHDYLLMFMMPFFSLTTAFVIDRFMNRFKKLGLMISVLVIGIVFFENRAFFQALVGREAERVYVDLAREINDVSDGDDRFWVEAPGFWEFAYPFVWNYAYGVSVSGGTHVLDDFIEDEVAFVDQYDYVVLVQSHPVADDLHRYLEERYALIDRGSFSFVQLK